MKLKPWNWRRFGFPIGLPSGIRTEAEKRFGLRNRRARLEFEVARMVESNNARRSR
jgi:hypothetical protein